MVLSSFNSFLRESFRNSSHSSPAFTTNTNNTVTIGNRVCTTSLQHLNKVSIEGVGWDKGHSTLCIGGGGGADFCNHFTCEFWVSQRKKKTHVIFMFSEWVKICLHVIFLPRVRYSIYGYQNNGQNRSITHSVHYSHRHHWHNAKQ